MFPLPVLSPCLFLNNLPISPRNDSNPICNNVSHRTHEKSNPGKFFNPSDLMIAIKIWIFSGKEAQTILHK